MTPRRCWGSTYGRSALDMAQRMYACAARVRCVGAFTLNQEPGQIPAAYGRAELGAFGPRHELGRYVCALDTHDRDVVQRVAVGCQTVPIELLRALFDDARLEQAPDQLVEAGGVGLVEEVFLDVEGNKAAIPHQVETLCEGLRRDVSEAEGGDRHETVEAVVAELAP